MSQRYVVTAGQPVMPEGYALEGVVPHLLPWEYIERSMSEALVYWVSTTRPDGRPHVTPIWGVWHDGCFWFDGSPQSRRGKNIAHNPNIAVNLGDGMRVVILEGVVDILDRPDLALRETLAPLYQAKYAAQGYEPGPETWEQGGLYRMQPHTALGWTEFGVDWTRWKITINDASGT